MLGEPPPIAKADQAIDFRLSLPRPWLRTCLPPSPAGEAKAPPESTGRILLLASHRFGAIAPRDETGKRRPLHAHDTLAAAQTEVLVYRSAKVVCFFVGWLGALAGGAS